MTVWFTSDTHFFHNNIIKFCERPFSSIQEMHETMIKNWNELVSPSDDVYHLGDFSFGSEEKTEMLARRLMGRKHLIVGNHDRTLIKSDVFRSLFIWTRDLSELRVEDKDARGGSQKIMLCHYPFVTWNKSHHGSWNLHGHCHGNLPDDPHALRIDVGVDCHDYRPVSYETIKGLMKKKVFRPVDHHGAT